MRNILLLLLDFKNYFNYLKIINYRFIKPNFLKFKELSFDYKIKFNYKVAQLNFTKKDLKNYDILSKKLDILGPINWLKDISSDRFWPIKKYKLINVFYPDNSDIKYIWEIGRLQFLIALGSVYIKTKKEKYAIVFKHIMLDFYKQNPIGVGPNWKCTMDVAIRSVNLIYAYSYFKTSKSLDSNFWYFYFNNLFKTGQFIYNNLEWSFIRGNHYLSDIVGLFYLGIAFKNTKKGRKWLDFSKKELEKEINLQINDDGVNFEGSISYHRLVTELFFYSYIFGKQNTISFSKNYRNKLRKMIYFVSSYIMNSENVPQVGDNDNGQLLKLDPNNNINNHYYLLQLSDVFLKTNFNYHKKIEKEVAFFTDKKINVHKKNYICRSFSQGFNIYKDNSLYLLIKSGAQGFKGRGGHCHNDQLSFILEYKKKYFFVDPGTYSYTGYPEFRNYFRSTKSHNTVMVDLVEQNNLSEGLFFLQEKTFANTNKFNFVNNKLEFVGEHIGYYSLKDPVRHIRKIEYYKNKKEIYIIDRFECKKDHLIYVYINLNPSIKYILYKNSIILALSGKKIKLIFDNHTSVRIENSFYSEKYGSIIPSKRIKFTKKIKSNKNEHIFKIELL